MTAYWVDDGGSNTAPFDTLAKAATSWDNLVAGVAAALTTAGNVVYCGHDHNDPNKAAHWTATGPTSGLPVSIISVDSTNATPTYMKGTGNQLSSLGGAYNLTLDGAFVLVGMLAQSGNDVTVANDPDEDGSSYHCTFKPADGRTIYFGNGNSRHVSVGGTIDCAADTGNRPSGPLAVNGVVNLIQGMTFANVSHRNGTVLNSGSRVDFSGCDFSGFTNATLCELVGGYSEVVLSNCKTAATWAAITATQPQQFARVQVVNCGPADAPAYCADVTSFGSVYSSTSIYRTSGGTVESIACSWLITTTANCAEGAPFYSPWMYGTVEAGSRTFDLYVTNDTADFTDAEVWLEVEYLSTADEPQWSLATDQRATITTTAAAQTDDTGSTWNGSGPSFTYKQKLSVAATVGESGQFRARVAVGVASIASSRYFYTDTSVQIS